jgi:DNA-binding response OmpR family regulator
MDKREHKKVLIIEDEELVREGIIELLDSEGFDIIEAADGTTGLSKAQQYIPDLIICDVMMPGLNGFQVLEALQKDVSTSTIPFIFLTAKSERADVRFGMDLGADDFITKPFKSDELFKAVTSRLHKSNKQSSKTEEKLDDLRKNIATILPHELRTPLNGILASSQLLLEYFDTMEVSEVKQLHDNIYTSAMRLNRLIINYLYNPQ